VDRLFLDANVLFSAAYAPHAGLSRLWRLEGVAILTSVYALEEARSNLAEQAQRARLSRLARQLHLVPEATRGDLPSDVTLPPKDRPILLAAMAAGATHLITGDLRDFGRYFGKRVGGVLVLPPGDYLRQRETAVARPKRQA